MWMDWVLPLTMDAQFDNNRATPQTEAKRKQVEKLFIGGELVGFTENTAFGQRDKDAMPLIPALMFSWIAPWLASRSRLIPAKASPTVAV